MVEHLVSSPPTATAQPTTGAELVAVATPRPESSLDPHTIVEDLALALVPHVADRCVIAIDGLIRSSYAAPPGRWAGEGGRGDGTGDADGHHALSRDAYPGRPVMDPPRDRRLDVVLQGREGRLGTVELTRDRARGSFTPDDRQTVADIAAGGAHALELARLYAAERTARQRAEIAGDRTRRLLRLTKALARAGTREEVARLAVRHGRTALGAPRGTLFARGDHAQALEPLATAGFANHDGHAGRTTRPSPDAAVKRAAWTGEEQWLEDRPAARRSTGARQPAPGEPPNARAIAALPLVVDDRILGALSVAFVGPHAWTSDERATLRAIAGLVAQALDRAALADGRVALVRDLERQHARLVAVVRQLPGAVFIADASTERIVLANDLALALLGIDESVDLPVALDALRVDGYREDGSAYGTDEWPVVRAMRTGETVEHEEIVLRDPEGSVRTILWSAAPVRDRRGRIEAGVATFSDVTERRHAVENRRFLGRVGEILGSGLDAEAALGRLARMGVPRIADWMTVDLLEDGALRQVAMAHRDPAQVEAARVLREQLTDSATIGIGPAAVVRTSKPQLIADLDEPQLAALVPSEEARRIIHQLRLRSLLCVPLPGRSGMLGTITLVGAESGRRFGPEDLVFAETLAARVASSIENARLFREADRFRRMVDAHRDVVLLFDPERLRIAYANDGAALTVGRDASALIGVPVATLFEDADEDRLRALVRPIVEGQTEVRTLLLRLRGAAGLVPVEVLVQGVRLPGEPLWALAIARDISERLESQERLRRLAEAEHARAAELNAVIRAMGDAVLVCGQDGMVTLANPAARALLADPLLARYGDLLDRLETPEEAPALGVQEGPVALRLRDAEERWLELATYPVGAIPGSDRQETIVVLRDVTELRLSQAVRDTFVGVLSHELRTPITTIFGGAKLLTRGSRLVPEQQDAILTDIHIEAERLHRLVEDVIALTRFGEEGGDIGQEPVLLQRILPGIANAEEGRWPGRTFTCRIPDGLPTVVADPTYVEQVVRNLLSNAAKYGGPEAHVDAAAFATEDEVVVRISDDGPGFELEEADRLFDLYFRSPATASRVSGAGIGLFVCARLIRAMGGRIWAQPRAGGGAEFAFALQQMQDE